MKLFFANSVDVTQVKGEHFGRRSLRGNMGRKKGGGWRSCGVRAVIKILSINRPRHDIWERNIGVAIFWQFIANLAYFLKFYLFIVGLSRYFGAVKGWSTRHVQSNFKNDLHFSSLQGLKPMPKGLRCVESAIGANLSLVI